MAVKTHAPAARLRRATRAVVSRAEARLAFGGLAAGMLSLLCELVSTLYALAAYLDAALSLFALFAATWFMIFYWRCRPRRITRWTFLQAQWVMWAWISMLQAIFNPIGAASFWGIIAMCGLFACMDARAQFGILTAEENQRAAQLENTMGVFWKR